MKKQNAIHALVDEHERALRYLLDMMTSWKEEKLQQTVDDKGTTVQDVLDHLVNSLYLYFSWMEKQLGRGTTPYPPVSANSLAEWREKITTCFPYCREVATMLTDEDLGAAFPAPWNDQEIYMIEQMFEHAIVHVWRHCRQLERLD